MRKLRVLASELDKFLAELLFLNMLSVTFFLYYTIVQKFGCVRSMKYVVYNAFLIFSSFQTLKNV